ncbi:putative arginine ABC transporter, ATP-binding protein ArtM [Gemelliphila asaccharolytica]|uniref:Arginine ABC transporter, ATP-binding protein ArtM n=2 Tax=Gemelliphila asaccharolytica TaxID=502393 RepID=A0ABR5TKB0_9BACL|nr:putative arginine ABC transporter, ATP-binding protein ArtM [Gemella asaccharolytica]
MQFHKRREAMLKLNNISKTINNNKILDAISLTVEEGEIVGLIGKSGSGKSTILRSISGLSGIDEGEIIYKGKVISSVEPLKHKTKLSVEIGMVFQQFNLFNHWNVLENIYKNLVIVKKENKQVAIEMAKKALNQVGLSELSNRKITSLSGGQKQRVAIARTIAMGNKVILFDEATSALDPQSSKEIMKLMLELKEKFKVTMIIVSHELKFIREICDKVYFIEKGKLIESGTSEEIFSNPKNEKTKEFLEDFIKN